MKGKATIKLSVDDLGTLLRALDIASAVYIGDKNNLPQVDTWRPSERAMASADMVMLKEEVMKQTAALRTTKP